MPIDNFKYNNRGNILPLSRLFPNIITLTALCCGMSAIRFAMNDKWENSVIFIIIAAFLDGIDGKLARLLKATSSFGAQLDSLADFLSFGIAPALVIYLWNTSQAKGIGWALSLIYTICCAIRLARFNTIMDDKYKPAWTEKFFVGIPSPAGAFLALIPMMISFEYNVNFSPLLVGIYLSLIGFLMASKIPTFYVKKISIKRGLTSLALVAAGLMIVGFIVEPWIVLPLLGIAYLLSIFASINQFRKLTKP